MQQHDENKSNKIAIHAASMMKNRMMEKQTTNWTTVASLVRV